LESVWIIRSIIERGGFVMAERSRTKDEKAKKPVELSTHFLDVVKEWQKLEDQTIKFSDELLKKTKNRLIKMTMEMIKHDSEKHKQMQQMLIDSVTKEPFILSPDELNALGAGLNKHMEAEAKSLKLAEEALKNSELFVTQYVLSSLIADEQKHHSLLQKLEELKKATVFVT
jgi:rubrerythrin